LTTSHFFSGGLRQPDAGIASSPPSSTPRQRQPLLPYNRRRLLFSQLEMVPPKASEHPSVPFFRTEQSPSNPSPTIAGIFSFSFSPHPIVSGVPCSPIPPDFSSCVGLFFFSNGTVPLRPKKFEIPPPVSGDELSFLAPLRRA